MLLDVANLSAKISISGTALYLCIPTYNKCPPPNGGGITGGESSPKRALYIHYLDAPMYPTDTTEATDLNRHQPLQSPSCSTSS